MAESGVADRIRSTAKNTDALIARLDTLNSRINNAREGGNDELVKYYEDQFAEVSVEFMDGVETIIDSWYELRGESRPAAEDELLSPDDLDHVHEMVVNIVNGLPPQPAAARVEVEPALLPPVDAPNDMHTVAKGPKHRVDITG